MQELNMPPNLSRDIFTTDPKAHALMTEAGHNTYEILKRVDSWQLFPVFLDSMRRVLNVYHGGRFINDVGYQTPEKIMHLEEDILFDLSSYMGVDFHPYSISEYLKILPQIEFTFLKFCKYKAKHFLGNYSNLGKDDICDAAELNLRRTVWWKWQPMGDNLVEDINGLGIHIWGRLKYLGWYLEDINKNRETLYSDIRSQNGGVDYDFEEYHELQIIDPGENDVDDDINNKWYRMVDGLKLQEIFAILEAIRPEFRFPLLVKFKYINPDLNIHQIFERYKISQDAFQNRLEEGINSFEELLNSDGRDLPLTISIAEHVDYIEKNGLLYLKNRILPLTSNRVQFYEVRNDPEFLMQLMDSEKVILAYATARDNQCFLYDTDDIAAETGYSVSYVNNVMERLRANLEGGKKRYIYTSGSKMRYNTTQSRLIRIKSNIPISYIQRLDPLRQKMYELLTVPDKDGRYLSFQEAFRNSGMKRKYREYVSAIEIMRELKSIYARNKTIK